MHQIGHFQITLIVKQRHVLFEKGEVNQIIAFDLFIVFREFDQNIIGIQITMDKSGGDINRTRLAPLFRFARIKQRIGKYISINQQACGVWIHSTGYLKKLFDISTRP